MWAVTDRLYHRVCCYKGLCVCRHVCCQKTVASSTLTGEVVSRSCMLDCDEGSVGSSGLGSVNNYCCKDKDLCNAAVKPTNHLPIVALLVGIAMVARLL